MRGRRRRHPGVFAARGGRRELRILGEDFPLELLQLWAGLEPELLAERPAGLAVRLQRVRLPAGAVEGAHQLSLQPLAEWVFADELLELRDDLGVAACGEIVLDAVLEHGEPLFLEAAARLVRESLISQVEEWRPTPERQRLVASAFLRQAFESLQVELSLLDAGQIARTACHDAAVPELPPQVRNRVLEDLRSRRRGSFVPERVDQPPARID